MIDSHCHLSAKEFAEDFDAVILRAREAGVKTMVTISDEISDIEKCLRIAEKYEQIYYTVGVHPHKAKDFDAGCDIPILRDAAGHPKCRGIGEIGLDYHYMNSEKDTQQRVFEAQLMLAKELDLPAVVHCREAVEDVWTIVRHVNHQKLVIHCCSEKWDDVKRFVDAGYLLSFTGIITYKNADDIRETVKKCPLTSLMVETDAPYLAPVPNRGKRCEPAFVIGVAKKVAVVKETSFEELDAQTTKNAIEFFGLPS